jgi:membrane-associated protein
MHTVKILTSLVEHHETLAYFFIFLILVFEGEFIVIITGILVHLGALELVPSLFFLYLGGMGKTFLGYAVGRLIHNKWCDTKFLKHIEKKVYNIAPRFKRKPFWSIFVSKFIMGVNHSVIIYAGYLKIDYRKYLKAEISSTLIWAPLLLFVGYFFGYTALSVSKEIWKFSLIALLLIIGFILLDKLIAWIYELFEEFYEETE